MDTETAVFILNDPATYNPKKVQKSVKLFIRALKCISGDKNDNMLENAVNILTTGKVKVLAEDAFDYGAVHSVISIPYRRQLIYKYLITHDFDESDDATSRLLHWQLIYNLQIDHDICDILQILCTLYSTHVFFSHRYIILQALQKTCFNKDKRCFKHLLPVFEQLLNYHFPMREKISIIFRLFDLPKFGVMEFIMCAGLLDTIKQTEDAYIELLMKYILEGFADNNLAFVASILFTALIENSKDDSAGHIALIITRAFRLPARRISRTLVASFTKYIVPIFAKNYKDFIFNYSTTMHLSYHTIVCRHAYMAKSFVKDRSILTKVVEGALQYQDPQILETAFEMICHFHNSKVSVTNADLDVFKAILLTLCDLTPTIKNAIRKFASQIAVNFACHRQTGGFTGHIEFYRWVFELICIHLMNATSFGDIVVEVFSFSVEMLTKPSSFLETPYGTKALYKHNPLFSTIFGIYGVFFHSAVATFVRTYLHVTYEVPVIEQCLTRVLNPYFTPEMIVALYEQFFQTLKLDEPWAVNKTLATANMLVNRWSAEPRRNTLVAMHNILHRMIHTRVEEFRRPEQMLSVESFTVATHVRVLTVVTQAPIGGNNYADECRTGTRWIKDVAIPFCDYVKKMGTVSKHLKKNIEYSLTGLMHYTFSCAKLANYSHTLLPALLDTLSYIFTSMPLKKLVVVAAQWLNILMKGAPDYCDAYISFYYKHKDIYVDKGYAMTFRKSGGVRHLLHILLRNINKKYFLESEIVDLLRCDSDFYLPADQTNLKVNLLECLISDSELKQKTAPYVVSVFERALKLLSVSTRIIRCIIKNSCMQLVSALSTRMLGPKSETGSRELSAFDLTVANSEFGDMLSFYLYGDTYFEVKVAVLSFLCESNSAGTLYSLRSSFDIDGLRSFLTDAELCDMAIEAYVAVCPTNKLYGVLMQLTDQIDFMDEDVFRLTNEVNLILRLYHRFVEIYPNKEGAEDVAMNVGWVMKVWNHEYYFARHVATFRDQVSRTFVPISELEESEDEILSLANQFQPWVKH